MITRFWLCVICISIGSSVAHGATSPSLILVDGNVVTLNAKMPRASAIAVSDDRILAIGASKRIRALAGPNTKVIDLKGRTVVPGLADAHMHLLSLGHSKTRVDLSEAKSEAGAIDLVKKKIAETPPGQWVTGRGWNQNNWPGQEFPTAAALDRLGMEHPIYLSRVDGHAAWVNSKALELAGINAKTEDPEGGKILRDKEGHPTGVLIDNATELVAAKLPSKSRSEVANALRAAFKEARALGLTSVHDMGIDRETLEVLKVMAAEGPLPLRVHAYLSGSDTQLVDEWLKSGPMIQGYGGYLTVRGIKLFADGALGSRGAALLDQYNDDPGNSGLMLITKQELLDRSLRALKAGFQIATHAIGDKANRMVLDAYEDAFRAYPTASSPRFRIEHAQILHPGDIKRFAKLGVIASMQATHCTSDMPWVPKRIGKERTDAGAYVWRSLLKSGAALANGSDAPVESIDPALGLYAAVTRMDLSGQPPNGWSANQRLSLDEALRSFTSAAASAAFEEQLRGSIEVGKLADFTIFEQKDIHRLKSADLAKLKVSMTIVGGREN